MMIFKKVLWLYIYIQNICATVPAWELIEKANTNDVITNNSNNPGRLFEFDIKLNPLKLTNSNKNQFDAAISYKERLWPGAIIPYTFGETLAHIESAQRTIQQAIAEWEKATCIRFIKKTNEEDFVEFAAGIGCNSDVGKIGGKQIVSLGEGCMFKSVVMHEIGHVVGFWHEQNRPDRDDYVFIKTENIKEGIYKEAFVKFSHQINSLKVEYDYYSIMHYGMKAFSKNNLPTILPKKKNVFVLGNDRLSQLDIIQASLLYKCEEGANITWTSWSFWSNCDKSCGGGTQERTRVCKKLNNGKQQCSGSRIEKRTCNLHVCPNWSIFPSEFSFGHLRIRNGKMFDCAIVYERADYKAWSTYSFCNEGLRSVDMRWSDQGPINGMKCTQIMEPQEPQQNRWHDNFICIPSHSPYNFIWSYEGPIKNLPCLQWFAKDGKDGWDNNFLCEKNNIEITTNLQVNGAWSSWSAWSMCNQTCGLGFKQRIRLCNNPTPEFSGLPCEGKAYEDQKCNNLVCACDRILTETIGTFNSPGYPSNYPNFTNCTWIIEGKKGKQIVLTVVSMDIESYFDESCSFDYLEIRDNGPEGKIHGVFCGNEIPHPITSTASKLWIRMISDKEITRSGFNATYELQKYEYLDCGNLMKGLQGMITSPNFPKLYPSNIKCIWKIEVPENYYIKMKFIRLDLEYDSSCKLDYLELNDGWEENSNKLPENQLGLLCGYDPIKGALMTRSNKALITFVSSSSVEKSGFKLSWRAYKNNQLLPSMFQKSAVSKGCPFSWSYFMNDKDGACYKLFYVYLNWHDAQKACASNMADLVSVTNNEEHNFLMTKLLNRDFVWLGMTDAKHEGNWTWNDNSAATFTNWDSDEPNDGGYLKNEDCSLMKPNGKWNDYPCSDHFNYVCKRKQNF
ncbi:tolloid-like protein 2 isoform X3 [Hydra vulgaris]|uniref:Metalloendopeptidase n=2 Tax=Hydra vulgaris TaxID=6087 RepID=A0ABM4BHI9_HYDVU